MANIAATMVPKMWSDILLQNLYTNRAYLQVANRSWEGEIKEQGDTVHITNIKKFTVGTVGANGDIGEPGAIDAVNTDIVVDQEKYFSVFVTDRGSDQMTPKIINTELPRNGAQALSNDMDIFIGGLYTGVASGMTKAATQITPANAYDTFVDLGVMLGKNDVPKDNRWLILPTELIGVLQKAELLQKAGEGDNLIYNGVIGKIATFLVLEDNNVPGVGTSENPFKVMAGWQDSLGFAAHVLPGSIEALRMAGKFATNVRGRTLFGGNLINTNTTVLANLYL